MKLNSYLLLVMLFALSCFTNANAKDKETKLAKNIVYIGKVANKVPNGPGTIICIDPKDKENPVLVIQGTFSIFKMGLIKSAVIKTKAFNGLGLTGDFSYSVQTDNEKNPVLVLHSITDSEINYSHDNITVDNTKIGHININNIGLSVRFDRNSKTWDYQLIDDSNTPQESITQTVVYPAAKCPIELSSFGYNDGNLLLSLCPIAISKNGIAQSGGIKYKFKNSDEYCNNELKLHTGGSFNITSETVWSGHRVFETATVRKKEGNKNTITIEYKNGDSFEGIVNNTEDIRKVLGFDSSFSAIKLWEGSGTVNGKPEKWIKGESFTQRHRRLSIYLDNDIVAAIECDSISEEQARIVMNERIQERERVYKENHPSGTGGEVLQKWFGKSNVTFKCNAPGSVYTLMADGTMRSTAEALAELGIVSGDIIYECTLTLNANGNGKLITYLSPSEQSIRNQRIHYTRYGTKQRHYEYVQSFCNAISGQDVLEDQWTIDDGVIKIKNLSLKINEEAKTVTYKHAVECCTLELVK